jgi:hypothetical protein
MACEDFPCCGHERGCCPDFDESGRQLNMKCVCGATVPIDSPTSLCPACLHDDDDDMMDDDVGVCDVCGEDLDACDCSEWATGNASDDDMDNGDTWIYEDE